MIFEFNGMISTGNNQNIQICLSGRQGEIIGILGPCEEAVHGISNVLTGLNADTEGYIRYIDEQPTSPDSSEAKQSLGVVFHDSFLSGFIKIESMPDIYKDLYTEFSEAEFLSMCEKLELGRKGKIRSLPAGDRAALKVITALSHHAKLLVLEDPFSGTDMKQRELLKEMIKEYAEKEQSCVVIFSNLKIDVRDLCTSVYLLGSNGLTQEKQGEQAQLRRQRHESTYKEGLPSVAFTEKLIRTDSCCGSHAVYDGSGYVVCHRLSDIYFCNDHSRGLEL